MSSPLLDSRLNDLMVRREELLAKGQHASPEDLCAGCPELLPRLRQLIAELDQLDALLGTIDATTSGRTPASAAASETAGSSDAFRDITTHSHYSNIRFLARGGLGEVVLAEDQALHRDVALKLIKGRLAEDPASVQRFLMEAEVTGKLEHPGVVPVLGVGQTRDGRPCYAMRYIRGETLKDAIDRFHGSSSQLSTLGAQPETRSEKQKADFASLEFRKLLQRFIDVCNTIAYAHSRGILHRDLKPQNIMLGGYGETLVVDWGLAKPFDRDEIARASGEETLEPKYGKSGDQTQLGEACGTPAYMSPEQAAGLWGIVGPASDIFSLGATLYYLLTGQAAMPDQSREEVLFKAQRGEFLPPRQVKKDLPRPLEAICLKAMAFDRSRRYATAQDLASDIENWLADEPVAAHAESWPRRLARWARRHRALTAGMAVAFVLVAFWSAVTFSLWQSYKTRQEAESRRLLDNILRTAEADERMGLADLHAARYARAEEILAKALAATQGRPEPEAAAFHARLADLHDQASRLHQYYVLAEEAERLGFSEYDDEATAACENALHNLRVFDHEEWWEHLPGKDLTEEQRKQLREDALRHLMLLCAFHTKRAAVNFGTPEWRISSQKGLDIAERVLRYRDCQSVRLVEVFLRLPQIGKLRSRPELQQPTCAADYYFMGMVHFWLWKFDEDQLSRWALGLNRLVPGLGLDLQAKEEKADRYFRMAAALEPNRVHNYVWLGFFLHQAGKSADAELCADACISLRPDLGLPYGFRAVTVMERLLKTEDPMVQAQLRSRCLDDLDKAVERGPHEPEIHYIRSMVYSRLQMKDQALEAYARLLEQDRPLELVRQLRNYDNVRFKFEQSKKYAVKILADEPTNSRAWAVQAHAELSLTRFAEARAAADKALQYDSGNLRALAVRGTVLARDKQFDKAIKDFDAVLARQPGNYLALLGKVRLLEETQRDQDALAAANGLLKLTTMNWQRVYGYLARARIHMRLGQEREARTSLAEARRINPPAADAEEQKLFGSRPSGTE
jgi:hypothetical protein